MIQIAVKYLFNIFSGSTPESGQAPYWDGDNNWFTPDDLGKIGTNIFVIESNRKVTEEGINNANLRFAKPNSIVITKRAPIGNLAITTLPSTCNQGCFFLEQKSNEINIKYYYYFFAIQKIKLNNLGRGSTFLELNADEIKGFKAPFPSLSEQNKIVAYLDKELSTIDNLIEKKSKQIKLLEEKKKNFINQSVTKGLNSDAPMKNSNIEWLGLLPKHWQVVKLKYFIDINYGLSQPPEYVENGTPLIRATNVFRGKISKKGLVFIDLEQLNSNKKIVLKQGDIIIVRSGAYTADSAIITKEYEGSIAGFDMVIRTKNNLIPDFLSFVLLSKYMLVDQLLPLRVRAAQPHLNAEEVSNTYLFLPSVVEQNEIVKKLQETIFDIDKNISLIQKTKQLLNEKRAVLISDSINGKIDF